MGNHSHKHNHDHNHNHQQQCKQHQNHTTESQCNNQIKPKNPDQLNLPHFGGQIIVDKVNKVFIKYIKVYQFEFQYVQNLLKKRMTLKHPNFITLKNYSFQPIQNHPQFNKRQGIMKAYCCHPTIKVLRLQFDPAILHVNGLIKQYCKQRRPMEQRQIHRIIKSVVQALLFLKNNNTYHGDIKPTTIFINPKTRVVQIIDSFLINNGKSAYQIVSQNSSSQSFLTPEQLEKKKFKDCDSLINVYQAEVFCIGLTLLQMMTFESSMEAYNLELLEIKVEFVSRKMAEMQQEGYSFQLADLALRCIHKDPTKRPNFQEILRILN